MSDLIKCPCCNYKAHKANIWPRVAAYEEQLAELDRLRREREETERALREHCEGVQSLVDSPDGSLHLTGRVCQDELRVAGLWRDPDAKEQGK